MWVTDRVGWDVWHGSDRRDPNLTGDVPGIIKGTLLDRISVDETFSKKKV